MCKMQSLSQNMDKNCETLLSYLHHLGNLTFELRHAASATK